MEILTIGYEGLSLTHFLELLADYQIDVLVDVRANPLSRKPGFSKTALSTAVHSKGFEYLHLGKLGAPKPVRVAYRNDGDWNSYTVSYLHYLSQQQDALNALAKLAKEKRCCLLCFEADANQCHRLYVAQQLVKLYLPKMLITHIGARTASRILTVKAPHLAMA